MAPTQQTRGKCERKQLCNAYSTLTNYLNPYSPREITGDGGVAKASLASCTRNTELIATSVLSQCYIPEIG